MRSALESLQLDHLYVVHGGTHHFRLDEHITAIPAAQLLTARNAGEALG